MRMQLTCKRWCVVPSVSHSIAIIDISTCEFFKGRYLSLESVRKSFARNDLKKQQQLTKSLCFQTPNRLTPATNCANKCPFLTIWAAHLHFNKTLEDVKALTVVIAHDSIILSVKSKVGILLTLQREVVKCKVKLAAHTAISGGVKRAVCKYHF